MVMITPALRALLSKHPNAEVHLLTSTDGRRVLQDFDARVTRMLIYERRGIGGVWRRCKVRRAVAAGGYSHIYCFETNPSYGALLSLSTAKKHFLVPPRAPVPYPELCLQLVAERLSEPHWLWLPVSEPARDKARTMLASAGIDDSSFVVGLHPSFSHRGKFSLRALDARHRKTWPLAAFAKLAILLTEYAAKAALRLRVMCDLLPQERPLGDALVAVSGGCVTLFTEPPDFARYKATIARMNLLVTPDTGPMHIAAGVGTPLVALFCGRDPRDCGPYTDPSRYTVLRAEEMEQPELGLAAISPERVFEACRRFLPS